MPSGDTAERVERIRSGESGEPVHVLDDVALSMTDAMLVRMIPSY